MALVDREEPAVREFGGERRKCLRKRKRRPGTNHRSQMPRLASTPRVVGFMVRPVWAFQLMLRRVLRAVRIDSSETLPGVPAEFARHSSLPGRRSGPGVLGGPGRRIRFGAGVSAWRPVAPYPLAELGKNGTAHRQRVSR